MVSGALVVKVSVSVFTTEESNIVDLQITFYFSSVKRRILSTRLA